MSWKNNLWMLTYEFIALHMHHGCVKKKKEEKVKYGNENKKTPNKAKMKRKEK